MSSPALPCPDDVSAPCMMYLLRHGATANNLARPPRLQGRGQNPELSQEGREQAAAAAEALSGKKITTVYSSPLLRAVETAAYVARRFSLPASTVDELIEVDVGLWEGRDWDEIARSEPEAYRLFMEDPAANPYTGGESLHEVAARVVPAFRSLMQKHLGETIAVVAHNVVNRVYLAHLLQISISDARNITQKNCGINLVRLREDKEQLITLNSVLHL